MKLEFTIVGAAVLALASGCNGGHTLYARPGPVCDKAVEAGQIWENATGIQINVVCVSSDNPKPDNGDWIDVVAPGALGESGPFDVCGETDRPFLGPRVIHIDPASVARNGMSLRDDLLHEMGHWLGANHLAPGQVGIMNAVHYPDGGAEHGVSCADVLDVCVTLDCPAPSCK